MRTVMIATPSKDGRVCVQYADALVQTLRMADSHAMAVVPVWLPGDALVQRARNSLVKMALDAGNVDDVMFIDDDVYWAPAGFFRLLAHDLDVVGGVVRQTNDRQVLCFRPKKGAKPEEGGLMEVMSTGTGFLRVKVSALRKLWDAAEPYKDGPAKVRAVFWPTVERGELCSEDVAMCHRWREAGGKVFVDLRVACGHVGSKAWEVENPPAPEEAKIVPIAPNRQQGFRSVHKKIARR